MHDPSPTHRVCPPETPGQMTDRETARVFHAWAKRVSDSRQDWMKLRAMVRGEFWQSRPMDADDDQFPVKVEVNLVKVWLNSFVANLFHRHARAAPRADPLVTDGVEKLRSEHMEAVRLACNRFLQRVDVEEQSESAYELALLYPGAAFKRIGRPGGGRPENRVELHSLPPWEVGWDCDATHSDMGFAFHAQFLDAAHVEQSIAGQPLPKEDYPRVTRYDDLLARTHQSGEHDRQADDLQVVEFYDLTGKGELRFYVVSPQEGGGSPRLTCIKRAPIPEKDWQGRPLSPVQPVVMGHEPGRPLDPVSSAVDQYRLNEEKNFLLTAIVNAARRRLTSVIAYLKGKGVTKETIDAIIRGGDMVFAPVDDDDVEDIRRLFTVVEMPEIKADVHRMLQYLDQARQDTSAMADQTRGKQGDYLSATESQALVTYSEQNALPLRAEMARSLGRVARWYLCFLRDQVKDAVVYRSGLDTVKLTPDVLAVEWHVEVVDTSSTPLERAKDQQNMVVALPLLERLAPFLGGMTPDGVSDPVATAFARATYDHLVALFDLPTEMTLDALMREAQVIKKQLEAEQRKREAEEPPPEEPPPPAPQMTPEEAAMVQLAAEQGGVNAGA